MSETSNILEVVDIRKHFGGVQAVDGCSFTVRRGSLEGLIGPNGAGKSTAIELISGFETPDSGTICFDGNEIQGLPPHKVFRQGLARCFQTAKEWPQLTVLENTILAAPTRGLDTIHSAFFARSRVKAYQKETREHALLTLERYQLYGLRNELAFSLSGGQKRLLEFARIAMAQPKLALLDEPMAGVNPVLQADIEAGIARLLEGGASVLLIEHNLGFVEQICDHVTVMVAGKVAAGGTMRELRQNPEVQDAYLGSSIGVN